MAGARDACASKKKSPSNPLHWLLLRLDQFNLDRDRSWIFLIIISMISWMLLLVINKVPKVIKITKVIKVT